MTKPAFAPEPLWQIHLLGELRAVHDEQVITRFRRHTAGVLLAYLAYHRQRSLPREELIELLWPECDPAAGRDRLSTDLSSLRRQLELPGIPAGAVFRADRSSIGLNAGTVTTDVSEFEAALARASRAWNALEREQWLREAVERYQGELLPGYTEDWILRERQHLTERYHQALGQVIHRREREGDFGAALEYARRAVSADPLREEAQHALIRLLAAAGQLEAARRALRQWEQLLKQELGSTPAPETRALISELQSTAKMPLRPPARDAVSEAGASLPTGTVTFLLMDLAPQGVEQRIRQSAAGPPGWQAHLRAEVDRRQGHVLQESDGWVLAVFQQTSKALAAAIAAQRLAVVDTSPGKEETLLASLPAPRAPSGAGALPRIALHTGETELDAGRYQGLTLDHTLRLLRATQPGQILLSGVTAGLLRGDSEPGKPGVSLVDLGSYRLRDEVAGVAVPERLFQACYPDMAVREFLPPQAEPMHRSNLPPQLTRFFGREAEVAHLHERLSQGCGATGRRALTAEGVMPSAPTPARLVTLTGAGGSGKTRLALAVAEGLVEPLHGAVWFVPLAEVTDTPGLLDAVATALELPRNPEMALLEQVVKTLSNQASLLLLDNFEGLPAESASMVRTLLERIPKLVCLVTSRQRLGLAGERQFAVKPLPLPAAGESLEQLEQSASVQLFVDRAQAVRPDFRLLPGNATVMAELCRRLEGLPLALELAAARTPILTPVELLAQLRRPLEVLVSRQRDASPRHRSLRATLQWSYDLLSPEQQRFFAGLSVFRGGWTLEGVAAVSARADALDCLEQLQACSLILAEAEGAGTRFRMLETMREFAGEQLTPEAAAELARRHAGYYLALAEASEPHLFGGGEQSTWLDRLDREHDNLRAALAWCTETSEREEAGLRLAGVLARFWDLRGYWSEGRAQLAALLEREGKPTWVRAKALAGAGTLALRLGDHPAARAWHEKSLAIYQELGDQRGTGSCLTDLGNLAWIQGDTDSARAFHQKSLAIARQLGDRRGIAASLSTLGSISRYEQDAMQARALLEESLAIWRSLGDGEGTADSLLHLGLVAEKEGCYAAARSLCEESLATYRELGNQRGIAHSLAILGVLARYEGDYRVAQALLEESLTLRREVGDRQGVGYSLRQLGFLAHARGDTASARRRSEEALAVWREIGSKREAIHQLGNLGHLARQDQDYPRALSCYRESLVLRREMEDPLLIAMSLEDMATVVARLGRYEQVARLLGGAEALCEPLGKSLPVVTSDYGSDYYASAVSSARTALGEAGFAAEWAQGRAMSLDQAIAYAVDGPV
jgi:predicted ATPase/DNA-binding SARP family transcriptional activator/uncharacterized protein HemY